MSAIPDAQLLRNLAEDVPDMAPAVREQLRAISERIDADAESLECVRQALPEEWRESVPSVAVATLAAEIERLSKYAAEVYALRDEAAAMRDDTQRYQWLRLHKPFVLREFGYSESQIEHWTNEKNAALLDSSIDAARAAA